MMASNNNNSGATAGASRRSSPRLYDHDVGRMEVYGVTTEYDSDDYDEEESPGAVEADNNGGEEVSIGTYEQQQQTNTNTPNERNSMRKLMNRIGQGMSTGILFRGENNNKQNSSSRSSAIDYDQRRQRSSSGGVDKKSKMTITENGEVEVTPNNATASTAVRGSGKESRKQQKRSSSSQQQQQQQPEEISIRKNYSVGMTYEDEDEEEFSEITTPNEREARRIERSYETKEKRLVRRRFETCIIWILLLLSVFTMIYLGMRHRKSKE